MQSNKNVGEWLSVRVEKCLKLTVGKKKIVEGNLVERILTNRGVNWQRI